MRTDEHDNKHLIADEGKQLRRVSDGWIAGNEVFLGYSYYLDGKPLDAPLLDRACDFEEVDASIDVDNITDETFEAVVDLAEVSEVMPLALQEDLPPLQDPAEIRLKDLLVKAFAEIDALKKKVTEMQGHP